MKNFRLWCVLAAVAVTSACTADATGYGVIVAASSGVPAPPSSSPAPAPPREVPTETHTGTGDGQFATSWPAEEQAFVTFDCPKCSSNVIVETDGSDGLLVNAIGAYHGVSWFNISSYGHPTTTVKVRANAPWTATITDYRAVPALEPAKPASGKGDAVYRVPDSSTKVAFTAKGRGHVALWATANDSIDLLINEIGELQKTVPVEAAGFVRIEDWEGTWTITPS